MGLRSYKKKSFFFIHAIQAQHFTFSVISAMGMNVCERVSESILCIPTSAKLLTHVTVHSQSDCHFQRLLAGSRNLCPRNNSSVAHSAKGATAAQRLTDRAESGLGPPEMKNLI